MPTSARGRRISASSSAATTPPSLTDRSVTWRDRVARVGSDRYAEPGPMAHRRPPALTTRSEELTRAKSAADELRSQEPAASALGGRDERIEAHDRD